jgi:ribonuclease HII
MLSPKYNVENKFEIGIDEAGRGPLFGRLYVAAVILPEVLYDVLLDVLPEEDVKKKTATKKKKDIGWSMVKDSKKIKNRATMTSISNYIKENAKAWAIHFIEHDVIDKINIRQSVFQGMHECIKQITSKLALNHNNNNDKNKIFLLIDGNDFKPYSVYNEATESLTTLPYETIEGGDNKYLAIAAASILAKCARDDYIDELCILHPELCERYNIHKNMGYGTKAHLDGIVEHGITQWHRASYGRCKDAELHVV